MKEQKIVVNSGMGFLPALTLVLIALKLAGVISTSWWWVLAPVWIPFALITLFLCYMGFKLYKIGKK